MRKIILLKQRKKSMASTFHDVSRIQKFFCQNAVVANGHWWALDLRRAAASIQWPALLKNCGTLESNSEKDLKFWMAFLHFFSCFLPKISLSPNAKKFYYFLRHKTVRFFRCFNVKVTSRLCLRVFTSKTVLNGPALFFISDGLSLKSKALEELLRN